MRAIFQIICFLLSAYHFSQSHFSLKIKADQFNDKSIHLSTIYLIDSTNVSFDKDNVKIENKRGYIKGEILKFPNPIEISYYNSETNGVLSKIIFIDNFSKEYLIDIKNLKSKEILDIENSVSQVEYNLILEQIRNLDINILPFDGKSFSKKKEYLRNYISKNPNSFVALWMIVIDYRNIGFYDGIVEQISLFDKKIKKSSIYKDLQKLLDKDRELVVGNFFPRTSISNKDLYSYLGKKYTFIDFWFSYCEPCIKQIPFYRKVYNQYKTAGFEMINISIDRSKDIGLWKETIRENKMDWYQILDENGAETIKLNINSFPTSFLLDEKGKIIAKNLSPEELAVFLEENIK